MKTKTFNPGIWLLDPDLESSARMLTSHFLKRSIVSATRMLMANHLHVLGIRRPRALQFYLDEDHVEDFMTTNFPDWPYDIKTKKYHPVISMYGNATTKWSRKCLEHHALVLEYLSKLHDEYEYRFNKPHIMHPYLSWFRTHPISLPVANLKTMDYAYKCLPAKYRSKDFFSGMKKFYLSHIKDPFAEYKDSKRDIPDFVMRKFDYSLL